MMSDRRKQKNEIQQTSAYGVCIQMRSARLFGLSLQAVFVVAFVHITRYILSGGGDRASAEQPIYEALTKYATILSANYNRDCANSH